MMLLVALVFGVGPIAYYFWRDTQMRTPSRRWPKLSGPLGLAYEANPPRMSGNWNGRRTAVEAAPGGATLTVWLPRPTRLRVECGLKDAVARRAGVVVPDPVEPLDPAFRDRLLARCSEKAAGPVIFDAALQQRLAALPDVDLIGAESRVVWTVPLVADIDRVEATLAALCAVADGLEQFPQTGGNPRA
jgi:hypothetical protein